MNRAIFIAAILTAAAPQGVSAVPDRDLVRDFVSAFYSWYAPIATSDQKETSSSTAIQKWPDSFDVPLLLALKKDAAAQRASPGEIVGLEFDPFLNTQDPAPQYTVKSIRKWQGLYWVQIYAATPSRRASRLAVTAEVAMSGDKCVFTNFYYPKGGSLKSVLHRLHGSGKTTPQ